MRGGPCWLLKLSWMGTQRAQMKGSLPWMVNLNLSCRYKRFLLCLGCCSRPHTKYFFPHRTVFQFLCPHRPAAGEAAVLGHLSLIMSLGRAHCTLYINWPGVQQKKNFLSPDNRTEQRQSACVHYAQESAFPDPIVLDSREICEHSSSTCRFLHI